jgi:lipopolysaccharide transport system permease protein
MIAASHPATLGYVLGSLVRHRTLVWLMVAREVAGRYRGSLAGLLWSFFNPVFMLVVYTFVFSTVFKMRWPGGSGDKLEFAAILFSGMIVHSIFAECVTRAPTLILSTPNLVKKVVFPLEVLPWVATGSALFHAAVSSVVLILFLFIARGGVPWTALLFPLVIAPYVVFTIGVSWWLASIGVYVRDVAQMTGVAATVLMFLSPVFYPLAAVPEALRVVFYLNPLTFVIEQSRELLLWGHAPNWAGLALYTGFAFVVAWAGLFWFQKTRKGFADVL